MMRWTVVWLSILASVTGCSKNDGTVTVTARPSSPYADGKAHVEPVFFNDKHYDVSMTYISSASHYAVEVAGRNGRKLGATPGDQKVVQDLAASTVRHFACGNNQKAQIIPGSARHTGSSWSMQARCI